MGTREFNSLGRNNAWYMQGVQTSTKKNKKLDGYYIFLGTCCFSFMCNKMYVEICTKKKSVCRNIHTIIAIDF